MSETQKDWYEDRHELCCGWVFRTMQGDIVRLDHPVPGDGTKWYVLDWDGGWFGYGSTVEPGDLAEFLSTDGTFTNSTTDRH